ncbi:MAG: 16S rRNA (guanine(527)-N(7))-methyltransferase RsmG [Clostridia bacterium]|nr:16S rRNA (guanine(527)-N(7))-methyltransferase RsmG [Clostridia bacterium]MBR6650175.1 16S rRNA (guanine(527)-N(7))-methyltransferase RsmG [Clostridia bacterium]
MFDINTFSNKLKQYSEGIPEKFLSDISVERLYKICLELEEKSKLFNLTAITDPDEVIKKHIVDCLFLASEIENWDKGNGKILDVGSGAGFPSLPVAAVLDDYSMTALDSTAKKINYIKNTSDIIGVTDFDAVASRAEDAAKTNMREAYDIVTARAVARLSVLAELCIPFLKVGGYFISMKGAAAEEEVKEAESAVKKLGCKFCKIVPYTISNLPDKRFLVIYKKISSTAAIYPRNYSQISKKPL